ncbi:MAG: bifunctional DNA primase/helicase [Parcubacteria group bacterium]|nr:bifunctional DNA primase/helicase [Parcubacteria group bacterium]|tara:strand:+ start:9335 stop:11134 length:1800 start_codon:yes stop_codon:yes gene_type:complete
MTVEELNNQLASQVKTVCMYLLPNGEEKNGRWKIGSIRGEAGQSMSIQLTGNKSGRWYDHDGGRESKAMGDMVELWKQVRGRNLVDTIKEIKDFLGIKDEEKKRKKYQRPVKPKCSVVKKETAAHDWLTEERNITENTLKAYKIGVNGNKVFFPYLRNDELIMYKTRKIREKEMFVSKDSEPILFGWQSISEDAREIIITEGEIDCMSYYDQGLPAVSVPIGGGGGNKQRWIEYEFDNLERFNKIFLSMDSDSEGQKALKEISARLGKHRCYSIDLPEKDANECHMKGIQLKQYVDEATLISPVKKLYSFMDAAMRRIYPEDGDDLGMGLPWKENTIRFRPGEGTVWGGINGHGKSLLLGNLLIHGATEGYKSCIASMEMKPEITLERILKQTCGVDYPTSEMAEKSKLRFEEYFYVFDVLGTAKVDDIFSSFIIARTVYGCTQFVVDSLAKCGIAETDMDHQKLFVERLSDFTREYDCHVHLICHIRKPPDESIIPDKMDIKGSGALSDLLDNVCIIWRNKPKEDAYRKLEYAATERDVAGAEKNLQRVSGQSDVIIRCQKQRNGDWEGVIPLTFHPQSLQYLKMGYTHPVKYVNDLN